jgi:hypothetical protein
VGIVILIFTVLVAGISFGFMLGFSRAMREAASHLHTAGSHPMIPKIMIGAGCAVLVVALVTALHTWHFTRVAQRTSGTVTEMRQQTDKDSGSISYSPTFRFQDAAGVQHTVSSSFYSSPPEFHVGDSVTVLYRSDDPQTARIDSYWQVWGLPSLLGIIGSGELPIGLVVLFWPKITGRFRKQTPQGQTF